MKAEELIKELEEYIRFLGEHLSDYTLFAHTHGHRANAKDIQQ